MRFIFVSIIFFATCITQAHAAITVDNAKARATFALAKTGAAYMEITNTGEEDDVLQSVSVSDDVAANVEIHTIVMDGEMMQMRELEEGLVLPATTTTTLAPGGFHLMLMGLAGPLEEGKSISMTLHFASSESKTLSVPVVKM